MSLTVIPARSKQEFAQFMDLPWSLYEQGSLWTPSLKFQDRELLTPGKHPFWESARRELFVVLRDGRPVGRIAAIVDEKYNTYANEKCGAFGFFECANDQEAAHALLDAARQWLGEQVRIAEATLKAQAERARLVMLRYDNGSAPYFEWLDAQRDLLTAEQQWVQARRALLSSKVRLYAALGGGSQDIAAPPVRPKP